MVIWVYRIFHEICGSAKKVLGTRDVEIICFVGS